MDKSEVMVSSLDALEITRKNIREYSYGIACGRAYPGIKDGLKQSYRRAIYGMYLHNTHKIVKVAELAAFALPYHPHPTSIGPVIVSMGDSGNKLKLLETQGNFGNSEMGVQASAERYIGGYLSDIAEKLLCDSVEYTKFVKGEIDKDEPESLPALIPFCFINGLTGIPSGLPTLNIPTMDMDSLFDYYIDILSHKDVNYQPKKLPLPNFELDILSSKKDWENLLKTGKGTIKVAPVMSIDKNGIITIISLPGSKNIETVQKIIEPEYLSEKVDIRDESTDKIHIVIEKVPRKQCNMQELYERLYKKLQSSDNYNMAFFDEEKIYVPCSFNKVVRANLQHVIETHKNRIAKQSDDLKIKLRVLEVIDELKVSNNIKKIAELSSEEAVEFIATKYKVDKNIASKVFQKPLSYLTKEHSQELEDLRKNIAELENDDKDIYEFLLKKYKKLKAEIGKINNGRFLETKFIVAK